jgi:hypothetical protein
MKKRLSNRLTDDLPGYFRRDCRVVRDAHAGQMDANSAASVTFGGPFYIGGDNELSYFPPTKALGTPHLRAALTLAMLAHHPDLSPVGHDAFVATGSPAGRAISQRPAFTLASRASLKDGLLDKLVTLACTDAMSAGSLNNGRQLEVPFLRYLPAYIVPHQSVTTLYDFRQEGLFLSGNRGLERPHNVRYVKAFLGKAEEQQVFLHQFHKSFPLSPNLVG